MSAPGSTANGRVAPQLLLSRVRRRYVRCLQAEEQYFAPVRFGRKVLPQPSQASSGRRSRRFRSAMPLRATAASHSREQVSSLGVRLLIAARKGRPQLKHLMAFLMSSPRIEIEICVHDERFFVLALFVLALNVNAP